MDTKGIIIYTDGSSRGNPGPGGWGAVVLFADERVRELGAGDKHTTNNRMELSAAIEALRAVGVTQDKITLFTDSSYVVNGITKWVHGWQANGWKTKQKDDVLNKDLWQDLVSASKGKDITWKVVSGHAGLPGNERVDAIATAYADGKSIDLYEGPYGDYGHDLRSTSYDEDKQKRKASSKGRSGKAYSYVSLVDGVFEKHATWAECEARVKGKSGVKFKKTLSPEEEKAIMNEWGVGG